MRYFIFMSGETVFANTSISELLLLLQKLRVLQRQVRIVPILCTGDLQHPSNFSEKLVTFSILMSSG